MGGEGLAVLGTALAVVPTLPPVAAKSDRFSEDKQEYGQRDGVMRCKSQDSISGTHEPASAHRPAVTPGSPGLSGGKAQQHPAPRFSLLSFSPSF